MSKRKEPELSHEEIWDDSALVEGWNEALREYKRYHSLHARGEKVEDVIRKAKDAEARAIREEEISEDGNNGAASMDLDEDVENSGENQSITRDAKQASAGDGGYDANLQLPTQPVLASAPTAALPQAMLADSPLKNLMMSWYYAGYYTGLYEGQQMAQQSAAGLDTNKKPD